MFRFNGALTAGLAAMAFGGFVLASTAPADAGASTGRWRNGMVAGPAGPSYYGSGYRAGGYAYRNNGYAYRNNGYRRSRNYGGAVAAGVIGGLALGALATAPSYAYPADPYYGVSGGYGGYAPACYTVRRRYVDAWGRPFSRREEVCE